MFVGHFAVAFGAKRLAPALSLGTLFLAAQLADLIWPVLVLAGVEQLVVAPGVTVVTPLDFVHYPYSHSLLALAGWGVLVACGWLMAKWGGLTAALVLIGTVVSHWLLDWITHRPDLPLGLGDGPKVGLGLWNSLPATLAVEGALLAVGLVVYLRTTRARDRTGRWALVALVVFLVGVYLASVFGPPPPSPRAVAATALSMWLLVAWGYWIDRHRALREDEAGEPAVGSPA